MGDQGAKSAWGLGGQLRHLYLSKEGYLGMIGEPK